MRKTIIAGLIIISIAGLQISAAWAQVEGRWSSEKAWKWYTTVSPLKGFNFLPSTAVNSTEMWQAATFDLETIERELRLAQSVGYNSARVFLQYLVWKDDPEGLKNRIDAYLRVADKHGITTMFILFDDCAFAGKEPYLGPQDAPVPGVHNSGWTPSPGPKMVVDQSTWSDLEAYVTDIVGTFKDDKRVVVWDLYNEPGNSEMHEKSLPLLEASFQWARAINPVQPLTVAPWGDFYNIFSPNSLMTKRMFELSDVLTFHAYEPPALFRRKVQLLDNQFDRPLICTEWLFRQNGGTFANIMPIFSQHQVGWYNWGLVAGKTQTYLHWASKKGDAAPTIWQHDIFHNDGKIYNTDDPGFIRRFSFDENTNE